MQLPDIEAIISECRFAATRSRGKGGQNVNKVATKVILQFNVLESNVLSQEQKDWILKVLSGRISKTGVLRLSSERERSQIANRKRVMAKFTGLLQQAFDIDDERIATRPTRSSKAKRLDDKKALSTRKADRSRQWNEGDES